MEICLADFAPQPTILSLRDGLVYINGELQPIKYVTEDELIAFNDAIKAIPQSEDPGYTALINARRTQFLVSLLGRAVGEECINFLTTILDKLHASVLDYLQEDAFDMHDDHCHCGDHNHA